MRLFVNTLFFLLSTRYFCCRIIYIGQNSEIGNGGENNPYSSFEYALKYIIEQPDKSDLKITILDNLFNNDFTTSYEISAINLEIEYFFFFFENFYFYNH